MTLLDWRDSLRNELLSLTNIVMKNQSNYPDIVNNSPSQSAIECMMEKKTAELECVNAIIADPSFSPRPKDVPSDALVSLLERVAQVEAEAKQIGKLYSAEENKRQKKKLLRQLEEKARTRKALIEMLSGEGAPSAQSPNEDQWLMAGIAFAYLNL